MRLLAIALVLALILPALAEPYTEGRVVCALCAAREHHTRYGELVLWRVELPSDATSWWRPLTPAGHAHEWHAVGCWGFGLPWPGAVSCVMVYEQNLFLSSLPRFRDQDLARAIAERLVHLDPEERWSELVESAYLAGVTALVEPVPKPLRGITLAEQRRAYAEWHAAHPRWHDLFARAAPR